MKRNILTILLCCFVLASWAKDVVWYSGRGSVEYSFVGKRTGVVDMALNMFAEDMRAVTGHRAEHRAGAVIEIFELDKMRDKDFRRLQRRQVPIDRIIAKDDAFAICVEGGHIVVLGSNANGTAYGILELSRLAGVSPWAWWGDVTPLRRHYLALASDYLTISGPRWRGVVSSPRVMASTVTASTSFSCDSVAISCAMPTATVGAPSVWRLVSAGSPLPSPAAFMLR